MTALRVCHTRACPSADSSMATLRLQRSGYRWRGTGKNSQGLPRVSDICFSRFAKSTPTMITPLAGPLQFVIRIGLLPKRYVPPSRFMRWGESVRSSGPESDAPGSIARNCGPTALSRRSASLLRGTSLPSSLIMYPTTMFMSRSSTARKSMSSARRLIPVSSSSKRRLSRVSMKEYMASHAPQSAT